MGSHFFMTKLFLCWLISSAALSRSWTTKQGQGTNPRQQQIESWIGSSSSIMLLNIVMPSKRWLVNRPFSPFVWPIKYNLLLQHGRNSPRVYKLSVRMRSILDLSALIEWIIECACMVVMLNIHVHVVQFQVSSKIKLAEKDGRDSNPVSDRVV